MNRKCMALASAAIVLLLTSASYGATEHHQIVSTYLEEAGEATERELSVYVPEAPAASGDGYPVLYLLHGGSGTNRTFLGGGYPFFSQLIDQIHVDQMVEQLIQEGVIEPMIVVFPDVKREGEASLYEAYTAYLTEEIIAFVDANYPTNPSREARAIAGHSLGGGDSIEMALRRADMFSVVAAYSPYFLNPLGESMFSDYDQAQFPLSFWIYVGKNDHIAKVRRETHALIAMLEGRGLSCTSVTDRGNHWAMLESRISESIQFIAAQFSATQAGSE